MTMLNLVQDSGVSPVADKKVGEWTQGWTLDAGARELKLEPFFLAPLRQGEVLVEPIYGSWEGNMGHALTGSPVDICAARGESKIVLGNSGVARVLKVGEGVSRVRPGDMCLVFGNAVSDKYGYMVKAYAYDAPGTTGMLAKRTKAPEQVLIPLPENTRFSLKQWAAFSLRYVTAWSNWHVAMQCWRSQLTPEDMAAPYVWAWGGGVALAQVQLAVLHGADATMLGSSDANLDAIRSVGARAVDRRLFKDLQFDEARHRTDAVYRASYRDAEDRFLELVLRETAGEGASIFIDNIGLPVYRATLKATARQGVIATCGWKAGMSLKLMRAIECIARRQHVHTHYARHREAIAAMAFAEKENSDGLRGAARQGLGVGRGRSARHGPSAEPRPRLLPLVSGEPGVRSHEYVRSRREPHCLGSSLTAKSAADESGLSVRR